MADAGLSSGVRWSGLSVVGREVSRSVFTIALARLIGPDDFGIFAQATVYIGIVGLLLDQGFSSALIQRRQVEPEMPGAVVSVNLAVGVALSVLTISIAPLWASFMGTPQLKLVLVILASSLLIRSLAITPRAMLIRSMQFRKIAIADIAAAMCGGVLGVIVAVVWPSYWAAVVQIVCTDVVLVLVLLAFRAGYRPNLDFRELRKIAAFAGRAFAAGVLINTVSRNIDNLLVGRFQGPAALAFYALAYRLLLLPVQLASTTVGSVLFPTFARLTDDVATLRAEMARVTRTLAVLSLPVMALVAAAAPQLVAVVFGPHWMPAIPIVQVLAIAGALQAVYQPSTAPLVLGLGHAKLNLRYAWLMTVVTTAGIAAGLPFGPFGVAVGYCAATVLLVPVEWLIRRHLIGLTLRTQIVWLVPGAHVAIWVAVPYLLVAAAIPGHEPVALALGGVVAGFAAVAVLRLAHRSLLAEVVYMTKRIMGRGSPRQDPSPKTPPSGLLTDRSVDHGAHPPLP
jgi:O-antigen/teichoic acid export membrane protein